MRPFLNIVTAVLATIALTACSSPAATGTPPAGASPQPACDQPDMVTDSPETTAALQEHVELGKAEMVGVQAHAHRSGCQGTEITRIDFDVDVTVRDITASLQIGNAAGELIDSMEQVAPGLPGDVTLNFESTGQTLTLSFTRDQARQAAASKLVGLDLLLALGFPARTGSASTCAELPGKQPLVDVTHQAQTAFDKAGLSDTTITASVNGAWCGASFTPRQTEFHIALEWPYDFRGREQAVQVGIEAASALDAFQDIPLDSLPGDLPPRLVLTTDDWDMLMNTVIPLEQAIALRDSGLTGAELYSALGFPQRFLRGVP